MEEVRPYRIAVDTPDGLMVPVLRDADKKSLIEIAKEMAELGKKSAEQEAQAGRDDRWLLHHFEPGLDWRHGLHTDRQRPPRSRSWVCRKRR
ncbi:hypothetical protein DK37_28060 [Halomonas sp. SUBG004]|nr:hypothetical protein DK37_28060 [Halomonas sp. SUBG004]